MSLLRKALAKNYLKEQEPVNPVGQKSHIPYTISTTPTYFRIFRALGSSYATIRLHRQAAQKLGEALTKAWRYQSLLSTVTAF